MSRSLKETSPKEGALRVAHIPQIPGKPFCVDVASPREGALLLRVLADYDAFQFENNIKPDYCNSQDLEVFEDGEWGTWSNEDGDDIRAVGEALLAEPTVKPKRIRGRRVVDS